MSKWVTVFAQSQCGNYMYKENIGGRTSRSVIKTPLSGDKIRLRLGAIYDEVDIEVLSMSVAVNDKTCSVTVRGKESFIVKCNETLLSDEVAISCNAGDNIEIRTYFADGTVVMTGCKVPSEYSVSGDYTKCEFRKTDEMLWLSEKRPFDIGTPMPLVYGVDVLASDDSFGVVVFGASNEYLGKWTEPFEKELSKRYNCVALSNMSISGGRLLRETGNKKILGNLFGDSGIDRFERDIASLSGIKYVLVELGGNDIFQPNTFACEPTEKCPSAEEIFDGLKTIAKRAKENGIIPIIMTLLPLKYADGWNEEKLAIRSEVNRLIMSENSFLRFDFSNIVADEADKDAICGSLHLGDHVHLNDSGGLLVAEKFDYSLIK